VGESIQEKTLFQFRNTLERKQQSYQLREINDQEEVKLIQQRYNEDRQKEEENLKIQQANVHKEIEKVKA